MTDLNPPQRAAVRHIGSPLLVLAGAGSGKTRVITHKIAWLIGKAGVPAAGVSAVTFTNKAAREMKQRAAQTLKGRDAKGLSVSTFHTLGLRILRSDGHALGYRRGFTIMDATDSLTAIKELVRAHGTPGLGDEDALRAIIGRWKNDFVTPAQAATIAADEAEARAAPVYARYEQLLHACNTVDFDDLIVQPVRLLNEHPEIGERWDNRVRHLLVDEYQDTNNAQYELVKRLVGVDGGLTAVGDDDQSVYAWRGARPENLVRLSEDFPGLEVIKLEQNYRSSGQILRIANHLIARNAHVFDKRLWSELGPGDPVRVVACPSGEDEADHIAAEIVSKRMRGGLQWRDFAILYRGNFQARPFERALRERYIPYRVSGSASFFDRAEIKDVMAYGRLLTNPDDDTAFLRVVNTPRRQIGATTLERLGTYARTRGVSMLAATSEIGLSEHVSGAPLARLRHFADWVAETADRARRDEPVAMFRELVDTIGYRAWLDDVSTDLRTAEKRWSNVEELLEWIARMATDNDGEARDLPAIVSRIALMDMLDRNDEDDGGDCVSLMTLHAAKGLEFAHVFIAGMEEELLPHRASLAEDRLEEERRLAYVGMTRARHSLTLTFAEKRRRYGDDVDCVPSRFLDELPADELQWHGTRAATDAESRRAEGREQMANLRALLGEQAGR